jgi:hypothetical protein
MDSENGDYEMGSFVENQASETEEEQSENEEEAMDSVVEEVESETVTPGSSENQDQSIKIEGQAKVAKEQSGEAGEQSLEEYTDSDIVIQHISLSSVENLRFLVKLEEKELIPAYEIQGNLNVSQRTALSNLIVKNMLKRDVKRV